MDREDTERLLAAIRADIDGHQKEVARLRDLEAYLLQKAGPPAAEPVVGGRETAAPSLSALGLAEAAERLLHEQAPLTTLQITDALLARGYPVSGPAGERRRTLANALHAALRKFPDRFRRVRKGVWSLPVPGTQIAERASGRGGRRCRTSG